MQRWPRAVIRADKIQTRAMWAAARFFNAMFRRMKKFHFLHISLIMHASGLSQSSERSCRGEGLSLLPRLRRSVGGWLMAVQWVGGDKSQGAAEVTELNGRVISNTVVSLLSDVRAAVRLGPAATQTPRCHGVDAAAVAVTQSTSHTYRCCCVYHCVSASHDPTLRTGLGHWMFRKTLLLFIFSERIPRVNSALSSWLTNMTNESWINKSKFSF